MHHFHPRDLKWIGVKFLDPIGRVFELEGTYYRAIYPHKVAYTKKLLEAEFIRNLIDHGLLVGAEISDFSVEGYGMVLKHESCPFITRPLSWSREFLRDAALCGIDLNLALFEHGFGTIDLHTGNIQQIGPGRPIWIDWGSICPLSEIDNGSGSIVELKNYYLHPLHLIATKPSLGQIVRHAMYHLGGINEEQFRDLTGGVLDLPETNRRGQLLAIREQVAALKFPQKETQWGDYQQNAVLENPETVQDARTRMIYEIMKRVKPKKYIDLSCSAGRFSFMAARLGAKVYAVDYDETAIERLHAALRHSAEPLSITTAMADVMRPHEVSADFVTALALEHHLWLTQRFPVERIAEVFSSYTTETLLTEFMPFGLGSTRPVPEPLPESYRLNRFVDAFRPWFERIQVIYCAAPMSYSFRILILCSGKRNYQLDNTASVETVFAPFAWAAPDSFFRILCDHCGGVLATSSESSAHCPKLQHGNEDKNTNRMMNETPATLRNAFLVFIWSLGLFFLFHTTEYLGVYVLSLLSGAGFEEIIGGKYQDYHTVFGRGIVAFAVGIPLTLLMTKLLWRRSWEWLCLKFHPKLMVMGSLLGFAIPSVIILLLLVFGVAQIAAMPARLSSQEFLMVVLGSIGWVTFIALAEELVFRGMAVREWAARWGWIRATIVGGIYFGAVHLLSLIPEIGVWYAFWILLCSIMATAFFVALYLRSGSLWLPIGIHAGWNYCLEGFFGSTISGHDSTLALYQVEMNGSSLLTGGTFGVEASLPAIAVYIIGTALVLRFWKGAPARN